MHRPKFKFFLLLSVISAGGTSVPVWAISDNNAIVINTIQALPASACTAQSKISTCLKMNGTVEVTAGVGVPSTYSMDELAFLRDTVAVSGITPSVFTGTGIPSAGTATNSGTLMCYVLDVDAGGAGVYSFSCEMSGLTCNKLYRYHFAGSHTTAGNAEHSNTNTTNTSLYAYSTPCAPGSGTSGTQTQTSADITLGVTKGALPQTMTLEWGETDSYGNAGVIIDNSTVAAANSGTANVTATLTGLSCETTYHYRFNSTTDDSAINGSVTMNGIDQTVTTASCYVADIDGDGMENDYETQNGLDPNDPNDADTDLDGDGVSNLDEYLANTNPNQDDYPPVVTAPVAITVNSTELFSLVSLGNASASDAKDGALTPTRSGNVNSRFEPGTHTITWSATDAAGNTGTATQSLKVLPLVQFRKDQVVGEAGAPVVTVTMHLNGPAADYPVTVPYTVSGTGTNPEDHNLASGNFVFNSNSDGQQIASSVMFNIVDDGQGDDGETIILTAGTPVNAIVGTKSQHTITLTESNFAPNVNLTANQRSTTTSLITKSGGSVVVQASVVDPNSSDTHTYDWGNSSRLLTDLDSEASTFTFDPSTLDAAVYKLNVSVTDSGNPVLLSSASLNVRVLSAAPSLISGVDTDGDGIDDTVEGFADDDSDGISNYLDSIVAGNVLEERTGFRAGYLIEANPGLKLSLGATALATGNEATGLDNADFASAGSIDSDSVTNVSGYFDFEVSDLPLAGQTVDVVIALFSEIPTEPVYRKWREGVGWQDFVLTTDDDLASALGEAGFCPPPGDAAYTSGLTSGHWCVQLTIRDGGPNDADGLENNRVVDPGGIGQLAPLEQTAISTSGRGGSISPWMILLVIGYFYLGLAAKKRGVLRSGSVLLLLLGLGISSPESYAESNESHWGHKLQLGGHLSWIDSDVNFDQLNQRIAAAGINGKATSEDDNGFGAGIFIAYPATDRIQIELGYTRLRNTKTQLESFDADLNELANLVHDLQPATAGGVVLSGTYGYPISENWALLAKAGVFVWKSEYEMNIANSTRRFKDDGVDAVYGFGIERRLSDRFHSNLAWLRYNIAGDNIDTLSLSFRFLINPV